MKKLIALKIDADDGKCGSCPYLGLYDYQDGAFDRGEYHWCRLFSTVITERIRFRYCMTSEVKYGQNANHS